MFDLFRKHDVLTVKPIEFHTQILDEKDAEQFVARFYSPTLSTREGFLNFAIGYFSELGYLPIPLITYIYDNLK